MYAPGERVGSVSISADGRLLAASIDYAVHVWLVAEPFSKSEHLLRVGNGSPWSELSRDGNQVLAMGEATELYNTKSGRQLPFKDPLSENAQGNDSSQWCVYSEARFSPDGSVFAGKFYGTALTLFDARTFQQIGKRETYRCGQGIAFAGDGTIFTPESRFDARTLAPLDGVPSPVMVDPTRGGAEEQYVTVSCDGQTVIRTTCKPQNCDTEVGNYLLSHVARHAALSPEEHWLVSGSLLIHLPTGGAIAYDPKATEAVFAPNGDVIVGEEHGVVARYCRH
jgi:WD40 repeat protein